MRFARFMLGMTVCLSSGLAAGSDDSLQLPYDELAHNALQRAGVAGESPRTFSFERFLESGFLHIRLGIYDLYLPAADPAEASELKDYRELALTLLDAQRVWIDRLAPVVKGTREPLADLKRVRNWVKSWKVDRIGKASEDGEREVLDALGAKDSVREAAERFANYMGRGGALLLDRETPEFEPVVLIPDRERFVETVCIGGWLYPRWRGTFWQRGITNWTHCRIDRYQFLCLELTDPNRTPHDWTAGFPMNHRNPQGKAQQVAQLALGSLIDNLYESRIPPSLAGALSVNLVIDLFGECDTRADGDLRARRTAAREVFVPGGQAEGGVLPPLTADSRWRERHGADHFVSLLRQAQKQGADRVRGSKEKHRHFELHGESGSHRTVVSAPFLGAGATNAEGLPTEFRGDWVEFLRAYRSCFVWWLENEAERSAKSSREAFAALLVQLAVEAEGSDDLASAFAHCYDGRALSSDELGKKDLEGRFLLWLARQR